MPEVDDVVELAKKETARLQRELDVTNADNIALWLEHNTVLDEPMSQCVSWLACRIAEAHERAALQSSQPRESWQPIETAPKDGTKVDLWVVRFSSSGKHHDEHRAPEAYWDARRDRWRCKWMTANGDPAFERHYSPTHWLPLPTPPLEQENTEEREATPPFRDQKMPPMKHWGDGSTPCNVEYRYEPIEQAQPRSPVEDAWKPNRDPIQRLYAIADNADPLKLVEVQAGDLRALVAEHRCLYRPRSPVEDALDTVSRIVCKHVQLDDGFSPEQADRHAAGEFGLNFRCVAKEIVEVLAQSPAIDPRVEELRDALAKCQARLVAHPDRMTLDIQAIDAADTALAAFGGKP